MWFEYKENTGDGDLPWIRAGKKMEMQDLQRDMRVPMYDLC